MTETSRSPAESAWLQRLGATHEGDGELIRRCGEQLTGSAVPDEAAGSARAAEAVRRFLAGRGLGLELAGSTLAETGAREAADPDGTAG